MFGISTVARLGGVSVRTLRYYDEIGLLRPAWTDPSNGYRWYQPEQLRQLHRIVALRDMDVRLVEIGMLADKSMSVEQLRGILLLRRAEAHDRLNAEAERLARVEARINMMEENQMSEFDIVVKTVDPVWVVAISEPVEDLDGIVAAHNRLWPRVHSALAAMGIERDPLSIAIERGSEPIEFTAAIPVPDGTEHFDAADGTRTFELAGIARAATTVMYGDDFDGGFAALQTWITEAGEHEAGELREVYLDCDGPRDTWVVELQLALR